ncbi:hypothetical protein [Pedobacter zeae]|uniref:Uncharacterized protein n=1 Tax=Pedobacter zeae TaxID=1737356 RepID=A0A7W6K8Y8_9SPHI|nr:hypothetical protein [Pedobacter zeae]MBB4107384.1 hypothetical protein [Pedobacter zeae]GGH07590.1 hypothetical protein GCM10007422_24740 [Pedobacter zeae]
MNKIDQYDEMTLPDYINLHIARNKGPAIEARYQNYHDMLRRAGAKYKREL